VKNNEEEGGEQLPIEASHDLVAIPPVYVNQLQVTMPIDILIEDFMEILGLYLHKKMKRVYLYSNRPIQGTCPPCFARLRS